MKKLLAILAVFIIMLSSYTTAFARDRVIYRYVSVPTTTYQYPYYYGNYADNYYYTAPQGYVGLNYNYPSNYYYGSYNPYYNNPYYNSYPYGYSQHPVRDYAINAGINAALGLLLGR